MNLIPCPLCKASAYQHVYRDPRGKEGHNRDLVQCLRCSHTFVSPMRPQEYEDVPIEVFDCDLKPDSKDRFNFFADQFQAFYQGKPGKMLEIGCGMGHFILKMKSLGWEVIGTEPSIKVAEWARMTHNLEVVPKYYNDTPLLGKEYDAIAAIEVLEHTINPREFLAKMFSELKTPGFAYLTVPNYASMRLRADKQQTKWHEWPAMAPWGHLHYFTPGVLTNLLYETGFKQVTLTWQTGDHDDEQLVAACRKL